MKIVDTQQSISQVVFLLLVVALCGASCGLVAVFVGNIFQLDEWAKGWLGGFIGAGLLLWLVTLDNKRRN